MKFYWHIHIFFLDKKENLLENRNTTIIMCLQVTKDNKMTHALSDFKNKIDLIIPKYTKKIKNHWTWKYNKIWCKKFSKKSRNLGIILIIINFIMIFENKATFDER